MASTRRSTTRCTTASLDLFTSTPLDEKMRFRAAAPRLRQPGLFPDRGDQRNPSRPGRGLGLVPARLRHPAASRRAVSRRRIIGRAPTMSGSSAGSRSPMRRCSSRSPRRCSRGSAAIRMLYDGKLTGTNFGLRAELLSADERGPGPLGRRPAARARGCRPVHDPAGDRASTGCRCGTTAAASGCGCSAPRGLDHHQHRRLHAADLATTGCPRRRTASASRATARISPRRASPSRSPSMSGRTRCWRCCPDWARPNTSRSRRSPSTPAAPANSTATIMPSRRRL